jgi:hypothetical protein
MLVMAAVESMGEASFVASSRMLAASRLPRLHLGRLAMMRTGSALTVLLLLGFVVILLRFALLNHRSADRAASRVWTQLIVMAAFVTVGLMIVPAVMALGR